MLEVVSALFVEHHMVLMTQRRADAKQYPGHWEIGCGGKVEPGESLERALAREIREEIGVNAAIGEHLGFADVALNGNFRVHLFRCRAPLVDSRPLEVETLRWVPVDLILQYQLVPSGPILYPFVVEAVVAELQRVQCPELELVLRRSEALLAGFRTNLALMRMSR